MRKIILICLLAVAGWSLRAQDVPLGTVVGGGITVPDSLTDIPTHYDFLGKGGYRKVTSISARDAIKPSRLSDGMLVFVSRDSTFYLYNLAAKTWKPVGFDSLKPDGKDFSIQIKRGNKLAGTSLSIYDTLISSNDSIPGPVGFTTGIYSPPAGNESDTTRIRSTVRTGSGNTAMEATMSAGKARRYHSHVFVEPDNVELTSGNASDGSRLSMDTATVRHIPSSLLDPDFYVFSSSLLDTTFRVWKKLKFDQAATSIYTKNGDLHLTDQTGDYALTDLVGGSSGPETDPVWTAASTNYYTKTNLQASGGAQVHWNNITSKPAIGTVSSVGLSMPGIFTVTGSPITGLGTLTAALASQTQATVFAAPAAANGVPTFRTLTETDIPNLNWTKITNRPATLAGYGITDAYTQTQTRTLAGDTAAVLRQLINQGGGSGSLVTSNSSTITFTGTGTSANPLNASTIAIPGITNALLTRDANGRPAASGYITLNNKTLGSFADFTITAPNKLAVVSGTAPANYSQLYLNTDEGKSYLESNTSVYSQGVTLSPNSARMQVSDRSSAAQSSIWVGSTQAGIIADKVVNIERQIKTDRRRTGIQIDDGTGDINGIWIQDGLELPSGYADNALAGAYVRANKNLGVKIGFQGVNPGEKSAYINITNTGSILLSDANGGINIKYMTQMARGIKELIFLSIATTTIDIDLNPTVPSNIYRMNSALNGAKTINVINATVPANSIKEFEVWIPQGATVQSVTWFSGITWISSATMTAGKTNVFTFRTVDGINYVGNLAYAF